MPRFPSPWKIEERNEAFIIRDATEQVLCCIYFEDEIQRQMSTKRMSKDDAFLIAVRSQSCRACRDRSCGIFRDRRRR
jgi:hypothetical protein